MSVDYETATSYQFEVGCISRNDPLLNDSAMVIITVEPVNEFRPTLSRNSFLVFVNELTPVGTVLVSTTGAGQGIYSVSDRDAEPDNIITFTFTIEMTEFESYFVINSTTGSLSLSRTFDHDATVIPTVLTITIIACDFDPPLATCPTVIVTIFISESNDNLPMFSQNTYVVTESEYFPINDVIATVICTDADRNTGAFEDFSISEVIPNNTPPGTFLIDTVTGNITLLQPLDYEFTRLYEIIVLCRDNQGEEDNATVVIVVTDENDNTPEITTPFDNVININDRLPLGSEILLFQCTDADSNENGNVTYSIDINDSLFTIDDVTGNVTVASSLVLPDDNFTMIVSFTLICSDQGNPPLSSNVTLFIEVYKDDSTAPVIVNSSISDGLVSISEASPVGSQLLQVSAIDTTSPELVYSLINESTPGTFVINSTSGVVTVAQPLDRETTDMYTFVVVVTEIRVAPGLAASDEAEVIVEILDTNDNNPVFSREVYEVTFEEDLPVGALLGVVSCSDADIAINDTSIDYDIVNGSPDGTFPLTFAIDETTGNITLSLTLDYEFSSLYTINVVCLDSGGLQDNATVEVTVLDVNDNDPIPTLVYDDVIQVNDQSQASFNVVQFQCTDEDSGDNGNVTYSIISNGLFSVDDITGNITVNSSLDILADGVFTMDINVTVTCTDLGIPPLSSDSLVPLQIYKDDSAPPVIDRASVSNGLTSINEDASIGDILVQVVTMDTTSPSLLYTLVNESTPGVFIIDHTSGVITTAQQLDREVIDRYSFTVIVTEVRVAPGDARSDQIELTVVVGDINDNPPSFSQSVYNITRLESFPVNESIFTVSCSDVDTSLNGSLSHYEISAVTPNVVPPDTFAIDDLSGNITLLKPLDYEFLQTYVISVLCFDNEEMQDMATVEINLEDVNDNDPVVTTSFDNAVPVNDASPSGTLILRFQCTDIDSEANGNVTYSITDTSSFFSIDPISGDVIVTSSLILESDVFIVNRNITIQCSDQGIPQRSSGDTILLKIYKDDSTVPIIDVTSISNGMITISEGVPLGSELAIVQGTDTTSPSLLYDLQGETSPGAFIIDSMSGRISVAKSLDRETIPWYVFSVVVSEVKVAPFAGTVRRARARVNVTVQDENDNRPICNDGNHAITKYALVGNYSFNRSLEIAKLRCTDIDEGSNSVVSLTSPNLPLVADGQFTLNESSGEVKFTGILTKNATYLITTLASDQGDPPLSTTVNVTLIVFGERSNALTSQERLLIIIAGSVSGALLLFSCLVILCLCCRCCLRRRSYAKDTYDLR